MQSGNTAGLAQALKSSTRHLHAEVERTGVMRDLLRGDIDRITYCRLLRNLQPIYAALEAGLARHAAHPLLATMHLAPLARGASLVQDLEALHGPAWSTELALLPAAREYVARLAALARDAPERLLAHAYVRYLGDLSGGRILGPIVSRALGLRGAAGTRFYAFGEPDPAAALAKRFRDDLDAIALDADGIAGQVREAQWGFQRHGELFTQIAQASAGMPGR